MAEKHGSHKTGTKEGSYTFRNLPDTTTYSTLKMKAVDEAGNSVETEAITVATKKVNKPYVGDYVNYVPQSSITSYTVIKDYSGYTNQTVKQKSTLKWRILNINDDGTIDLISNTVGEAVQLSGYLGYNNLVYILNDVCNVLYSNNAYNATARSIKIEDIQDKMNLEYWDYHDYTINNVKYGQTWEFTKAAKYPYQWAQENSEGNAIDGVLTNGTLGQSEQNKLTTEVSNQSSSSLTLTQTYWTSKMTASNFKTIKTRDNENNSNIYMELFGAKSYKLASRAINAWGTGGQAGAEVFSFRWNNNAITKDLLQYIPKSSNDYVSGAGCLPIVTIPKTALDLSANYEETGIWNLK